MSTNHQPAALVSLVAAALAVMPAHVQAQAPTSHAADHAAVIEIVAEDYALDAPDVIPSGWTTVRLRNAGEETHMVFVARLPEGLTFERYEMEAQGPFSEIWTEVREGRADAGQAMGMLVEVLPEWFPALQFVGGPGLLAPGLTADATIHLEPGNYAIECYVKTEDGRVHYMEGMARPLTVSAEESDAKAPQPDARIVLSNSGLAVEGELAAGRRVIEVHVAENPEVGFGHSVHLARLEAGTGADEVVAWMDWFDLRGMREPAPVSFVGGMHPMGAGETAYLTVDLEPGRYLALSEATGAQGVFKEFTVR